MKDSVEKLKDLIIAMIEVASATIELQRLNDKDSSHKKNYDKWQRHCKSAKHDIRECQHVDILASVYNSFISGKEQFYVIMAESIHKNVKTWDTTKKGYDMFKELDKEAREKFELEKQERETQMETIKKARENGQKIDFVFENGKLTPVILAEKPN